MARVSAGRYLVFLLKLGPYSVAILGLASLIQLAFNQIQAETAYQAARAQTGIARIQNAFEARQLRPDKYAYNRELGFAYQKEGYAQQAYWLHREKLSLRTPWPFAWHDLARWYRWQGMAHTSEFEVALSNSLRFGSNETQLREGRLDTALRTLDGQLSSGAREMLKQQLVRELESFPIRVYARAALLRKEKLICEIFAGNEATTKWCQQMAYYRQVCADDVVKLKKHREWCRNTQDSWQRWK